MTPEERAKMDRFELWGILRPHNTVVRVTSGTIAHCAEESEKADSNLFGLSLGLPGEKYPKWLFEQETAAEKVRLEAAQVEKARIEAAEHLGEAFYNQFRDNFLCGSPEVLLGQHGLVEEDLMDADGIVVVLTPAQAYILACIIAAY